VVLLLLVSWYGLARADLLVASFDSSRAGNNAINHADAQLDALIDRMREVATEEAYLQAI